ncbi:hypothetical protein LDENG_00143850, partial [Lucifuga dentata]
MTERSLHASSPEADPSAGNRFKLAGKLERKKRIASIPMPSEAQSQEPQDRGPPPPVTRAGRSALLAKAAASSPDGSTGRSRPPTPPPPPLPPPPKSKKKGRSRGRAQVEDEESTDATEKKKKPPKKTEEKEEKMKMLGRRGSASRRKSNTNPEPDPEPSHDRLSPDPDPGPSLPGLLVPEPSLEPASSPRDQDRTSPPPPQVLLPPQASSTVPQDTLLIYSPTPASSPRVESRSLSPNHGLVCSPASPTPDPREEEWSSPNQNPPMELDSSPVTVPVEMAGAGVSPVERSPSLSMCPSPRLGFSPGEEEDSLSPLFQRSLSEESGGSPPPSLGLTKKRLKQCAFCYRGDEPPLGQGRLVVFGPTPGYIPLHILNRRASSDRDNDCHDHCFRGNQAPLTCSSPEEYEDESSSEFVEQLGPIGLPHDINVQSLFDATGQCCAHFQCASWSEGVCCGEGQSLRYVDKAIDSGSTQVCVFCGRLGASLHCQETGCGWSYHFPCASAAGAHQDWNQRHTLCTRHIQTVSSPCVLCSGVSDVSSLLMCCCCGNHYHGSCLDPPLSPSPLRRAGWQCPQCQVCQSCSVRGDDSVLLVCERCDKAYHTHCLTPALEHTPSSGWNCKNCRVCRRCGVRSSGQWANHPFLCESCDPAVPCPLCGHSPNLCSPQDYVTCICCYRCVHTECIVQAGEVRAGPEGCICSSCRPQEEEEEELMPDTPVSHSLTMAALPLSISQPLLPAHPESPPSCLTPHKLQQNLTPAYQESAELQLNPIPPHPDAREGQNSQAIPEPSYCGSDELQKSSVLQNPTQVYSAQPLSQHSPQQLATEEKQNILNACHNPTHSPSILGIKTKEDEPVVTESYKSPTQDIPMSCSPTHSLNISGRVQPGSAELQHCPSPHSPVQDVTAQTQLSRPCSPTTVIIVQSQHLDKESPESSRPTQQSSSAQLSCGATQDISTLDQESLFPVYCRPTHTATSQHGSFWSAPCNPSQPTLTPMQHSHSQPASPVQAQDTQTVPLTQFNFHPAVPTQSTVAHECKAPVSPTDLNSMELHSAHLSPNPEGSLQTHTPSQASTVYSSLAHDSVSCVGSPRSPAQASEMYHSPKRSPDHKSAPNKETQSGLTVAQLDPAQVRLSLDREVVANSLRQSSIPTSMVEVVPSQVQPADCVLDISQKPADSLLDGNPSQAGLSHASQTPMSSLLTQDNCAVESQGSADSASHLCRRPVSPIEDSPTLASPVHLCPTQDDTATLSCSSRTSEMCTSLSQVGSSKISSPQTSPCYPPQAGSVQSCPCNDPVCSHVHLDYSEASLVYTTGTPASHVQAEDRSGPASPDSGSGPASCFITSPQEHTPTEMGPVDVIVAEQQKDTERRKTEEEEMDRDPQERWTEEEERDEPDQRMEARTAEDDPERTEGAGEQQEEVEQGNSDCPPSGIRSVSVLPAAILTEHHYSPPHTASPLTLQPAAASPQPLSLSSTPPSSPSSPPLPPHRAGSLEGEPLNQGETKMGGVVGEEPEVTTLSCPETSAQDSLSQSLFETVVTVTESTKDMHQSHAEPSEMVEKEEEEEKEEEREEEEEKEEEKMTMEVSFPELPEYTASDVSATDDVVAEQQPMRDNKEDKVVEEKVTERDDELGVREQEDEEKSDQEEEEEEPVSTVLELDPSLDMEVMELMASSSPPPALLHLSSPSPLHLPLRRGKGRTLRPPPLLSSSRPSDDLSIRLRQSPFSTEASPETSPVRVPITPPPLSPPTPPHRTASSPRESPPLSKLQAPPTTIMSFTPKIGMGKPAISKRKFSPGRARVKQGSWWSSRRVVSPPSSSQDSMGEGGWDSPKPRPSDSPLWSMRVGRGSGLPGRRRSRGGGGGGVGGGRGGRGRSRLKTQDSLSVSPVSGCVEAFQVKEEEENSMHNTVVMFSTSDHFTLRQDMCVVCGSFGQGAEGRLLACSQCGQCYHPYCVNVKITRVVLTKGWRCLECTVCEACGEASDPGRLLLCDDCDISYHTYCLDPPLHTVPKGAWKCKWCVWCVQCGSTSPGLHCLHCDWQSNYSRCGPCASLSCCPLCQRQYMQDELMLQCQECDRWVHAMCQGLSTEEEVEVAADEGFTCSLCRALCRSTYGRSDSFDSPYMAQIISRIRQPDSKTYTQDGVCLTESGLSQLQSLVEPLTSPRRYRRCKPKLKLRIINQNSVSVLQTPPDPKPPHEQDHNRGELDCDMKSDSSPERDHAHGHDIKEPEVTDGNKKRKRKPYRPGIGGFMVRQRGGKAGPGRIKLCRRDSTETLIGRGDDAEGAMDAVPPADQMVEKVKKRYRKKKTKLEEAFPLYLQDAFFGRDLLNRSRQVDRRVGSEVAATSQLGVRVDIKVPASGMHDPASLVQPVSTMATNKSRNLGTLPISEEVLVDLSDVLNTDPHILATGHTGQFQVERSLSPFAGLDISSVAQDPSLTSELTGSGGRCQRAIQEEPLDAILSPELDKMVSDGAILSKLYKIPELEGKDVEEVFTAVLSPNSSSNQLQQSQHTHAGSKTHTIAAGVFPRLPVMNGLMGAAPRFPSPPMMPGGTQGFRMPPPEGPAPSPSLATRLTSASQASGEGEQDVMSTAQRGTLKWEKEETLGELATVAPVLYCNTIFPQLREQYP